MILFRALVKTIQQADVFFFSLTYLRCVVVLLYLKPTAIFSESCRNIIAKKLSNRYRWTVSDEKYKQFNLFH